uniref:ATP-dependent DNA helicase n=1 Tax=Tanacetum cinerariifolium TaxID=118510 RepID=A0A699H7H6_TANCI|nr:hypothetical protein [Tanacetum cinerariifolium]
MREYFAYRLREKTNVFSMVLNARRLCKQFIVDVYTMIERERMSYIRNQQKDLTSETYSKLAKLAEEEDLGVKLQGIKVVLPSSFTRSPRYMMQYYLDAMIICKVYGYPDMFITFTYNLNWPEIARFVIQQGLKSEDRHDTITRVFKQKLDTIMKDFKDNHYFGRLKADRVTVSLEDVDVDEIKDYYDCRYLSACEAAWRIYGFDIHCMFPHVERLSFYLLGEQSVIFDATDSIDYALDKGINKKKGFGCQDRKVRGAKDWIDFKTFDDVVYPTYKDAFQARGLLEDDKEYINEILERLCMREHEKCWLQMSYMSSVLSIIIQTLIDVVCAKKCGMFFVYGYGGTGERTTHSQFAIPINVVGDSMFHISADNDLAELIRMRHDVVHVSIKSSYFWQHCNVMRQTVNMRLGTGSNTSERKEIQDFADWILRIRNGTVGGKNDGETTIELLEYMLIPDSNDHNGSIIEETYPQLIKKLYNYTFFQDKAILAPTYTACGGRSLCFVLEIFMNVTPPDAYSDGTLFGGVTYCYLEPRIPTTVLVTTPTIDPPVIHDDTLLISAETPTISPIISTIPTTTPTTHYISPFIHTDSSDNDTPDTLPSPTHEIPPIEVVPPTSQILPAPFGVRRRRVTIVSPGQPILHGRPYRYHPNRPVHMMTARRRIGLLPTRRLATSSDSSSDALSDSSSGHLFLDHSSPALTSGMISSHQLCLSVPSIPYSSAVITERPPHSSSVGPSCKRSRSPTTSYRYLHQYVMHCLLFELACYHLTGLRDDVDVKGSDEPYSEPAIDPEIQAEINECIAYVDALRAEGIDARVVVETVAREEVKTRARGTVEVRVDRVTHLVVSDDILEPAQEERDIEALEARDITRNLEPLAKGGDKQGDENGNDYEGENRVRNGNGNGNGGVNGNGNGGGNGNGNGGRNGYENHTINLGGFMPVARECT